MVDEETKKKPATGDTGEGNESQTDEGSESTDSQIERAEKAGKELRAQLDRQENLMAKQALGGKSDGPKQPEEKKPMSDKQYKDYFLKHGKSPEE